MSTILNLRWRIALALFFQAALTAVQAQVPAVSNLANAVSRFDLVSYIAPPLESSFGAERAQPFTTGATPSSLFGVQLELGDGNILDGGGFTVSLFSNAGGVPGGLLATLTGDSTPNTAGVYSYDDPATTLLAASTTYWIVASVPQTSPDKRYNWNVTANLSETGLPGWSMGLDAVRSINNGVPSTWVPSTFEALKMEVDIVVPESSTWAACGAVFMIGCVAWRRQRR